MIKPVKGNKTNKKRERAGLMATIMVKMMMNLQRVPDQAFQCAHHRPFNLIGVIAHAANDIALALFREKPMGSSRILA